MPSEIMAELPVKPGGHELDGGDGRVADDRGDDGFLGFGCHAASLHGGRTGREGGAASGAVSDAARGA